MAKCFRVEQVADGVWAALVNPGTGALGNAGFVNLGDMTLVVDTFLTLTAARELRAAAEELTGRSAAYVVNTHFHGDHVHGNQIFADATMIATERTRELIAETMPQWISEGKQELPGIIEEKKAQLAVATDPARREALMANIGDNSTALSDLPLMRPTLPSLTFDQRITLRGSQRTAEVVTYGGGHTASDAVVWLRDSGVLFAGDLVLSGNHPWMGNGNPTEWIGILDRLAELPIRAIVPGHGPVAGPDSIAPIRAYLTDILALVQALVREGKSPKDAVMPTAYQSWRSAAVFEWNVGAFFKQFQNQG